MSQLIELPEKFLESGFRLEATVHEHHVDFLFLDDDAYEYIRGHVKWDGCSNWNASKEWIHFCGREQISILSELIQFCWDWTKNNLKTFDKDIKL